MASLAKMSVAEIRRELERRERGGSKLAAQHAKLAKQLAKLETEMASLGVETPKRRGRRPGRMPGRRGPGRPKGSKNKSKGGKRAKNGQSLAEALAAAVRAGTVVSPSEAVERVKSAGYKSSSKTFGIQVAGTLAKHKGFKRKGRGQYERVA